MGRRYLNALVALVAMTVSWPMVASAQGPQHHNNRSAQPRFNTQRHPPEIRSMPSQQPQQQLPPRFYQLSPDERQLFRRNAERWLQMDAKQQQMLRDRERMLRDQRRREAEQAMHDLGLQLDNQRREQFEQRYLQERRQIERQLRLELDARRQQELPQLRERLKGEFHGQNGSPTPMPPIVSPIVPRD